MGLATLVILALVAVAQSGPGGAAYFSLLGLVVSLLPIARRGLARASHIGWPASCLLGLWLSHCSPLSPAIWLRRSPSNFPIS